MGSALGQKSFNVRLIKMSIFSAAAALQAVRPFLCMECRFETWILSIISKWLAVSPLFSPTRLLKSAEIVSTNLVLCMSSKAISTRRYAILFHIRTWRTLGTRGNSLAKSGRPKAGETSVRSEVSEASEGPNASSLWWRTPTVSLC